LTIKRTTSTIVLVHMTIRLTRKLAEKLRLYPLPKTVDPDRESVWYGNLFRVLGVQFIIMMESKTLVCVLFKGQGIVSEESLVKIFHDTATLLFERRGWSSVLGRAVSFNSETPTIVAAQDRRLLGCLNDMINQAKWDIQEDQNPLADVMDRLNRNILSYTNYKRPEQRLEELVEEQLKTKQ
jgi:hypothetical protein